MNSDNFYIKYLKYKQKYINNKQNGGTKKIFYLYTTGIADGDNLQYSANTWITIYRSSILRNIHSSFNNIIIRHYDPLMWEDSEDIKCKLISKINKKIIKDDIRFSNIDRTINSEFICGTINFSTINFPHLILDMAHIFNYLPNKQIQLNNHYGKSSNKKFNNIKSVYTGWCGEKQLVDDFSKQFIAASDFVIIEEDGSVKTYIDRIIYLNYNKTYFFNSFNPENTIMSLFFNIKDRSSVMFNEEISLKVVKNIINIIMTEKISIDQLKCKVIATLQEP